jgi:hypothetical protein
VLCFGSRLHENEAMSDWETVREVALGLPEVEEHAADRPGLRVRGKLFVWMARERDGGGLAVRVDRDEKQLILDSNPRVYFSSSHYDGYPAVQIRLDLIDSDELRERIEDVWLIQAPKRLAAEYAASYQPEVPAPPLKGPTMSDVIQPP